VFTYNRTAAVTQENNGHTVEWAVEPGNVIEIRGTPYELSQFHYHSPSEHKVAGRGFPIEVHMVHESDEGDVLVVTVFAKEGRENVAWAKLVDKLPSKKGDESESEDVDLAKLISPNRGSSTRYSYSGSLTTPPCSEPVQFEIYRNPIELSGAQIGALRSVYSDNARPVQPRNGRELRLGR
jgi:carbonic anhydrase